MRGQRSGDPSHFGVGWGQGGRGRAHQEIGMAQDLCPRFLDYFGMGHFHHKVRVPRSGERWGGPWRESRPPLPRFPQSVVACRSSLRPGRGNGMGGLVPGHTWVTQGPERVGDLPEVTQKLREARTGASLREPRSLRARSLTSPQGQRGPAAAGRGALSLPGVLGLDSRQKPVPGPVPAPESAGGRPGTVLGGGKETQRTGDGDPGGGGRRPREGGRPHGGE